MLDIYSNTQAIPLRIHSELHFLSSQADARRGLWDYLNILAPFDKHWYGRLRLNKDV